MKKIFIFLASAILLSSCSLLTAVTAPALEATNPPTSVNTPTASVTPIIPTPTFTATPPLVGQKTRTSTPSQTPDFTPTQVSVTPLFLITPNTATPSVAMNGFIAVNISVTEFYKGTKCQPASVLFSAQAADPAKAAFVVLSVRFKSKQTGTTSKWTSVTMQSLGAGSYSYDLISEIMKGVDLFENAWVQYQFVATDSNSREIGRTGVFSERLTLLECEATPTPEPSATALVP